MLIGTRQSTSNSNATNGSSPSSRHHQCFTTFFRWFGSLFATFFSAVQMARIGLKLFIIYTGGRHQGILLYLCRHALNLLANLEIKNLLGRPWLCSLHGPCRALSTTTRHYIHYITDHQRQEIHSSSFGLMQTKTSIKLTFIKID